ncbi:hypothetical protein PITCH_A1000002 [uncultured Desulfobacterium sp.]|uniref:Uncharacterized protein n=1 Tax=uncultured Desulfobacterium sp. TaxID=201089 RepID=A0A445MQI5_9BACT|nr:hypothetical protein PITCH_A1000002 [uncultured Desulfobacterium sp.]
MILSIKKSNSLQEIHIVFQIHIKNITHEGEILSDAEVGKNSHSRTAF